MRDQPDDRRSVGRAAGRRTNAVVLALFCMLAWTEGVSAQEPSIGDRMGDFFKRMIPGSGDQAQPAQPPTSQPPATPQPAPQQPAAAPSGTRPGAGQTSASQPAAAQAPAGGAPAPGVPAGPPTVAQEPSVGDRVGDFFKRFVPGGDQPQPGQAQGAQPAPSQPAGMPAPAAQAPTGQAPAAQAAPGTASPPQAPPRATARRVDPSLTDRVGDFFKRLMPGSQDEQATALPAGRASTPDNQEGEFDCPVVDIREGASTLMVQGPGESQALSLRYQASFVRAARECIVKCKDVTIKVGIQGRVILGPAGGPGQLTIRLRYALVHAELGRTRMIWSKLYVVPVEIPGQQPNVPFAHVEDDMTVPIPRASELENYIVYIGFDPNGVPEKKPPPAAK